MSSCYGLLKVRVIGPLGYLVAELVLIALGGTARDFKLSDDLIKDAVFGSLPMAYFLKRPLLAEDLILLALFVSELACSVLVTVDLMLVPRADPYAEELWKEVGNLSLLIGETVFYVVKYFE